MNLEERLRALARSAYWQNLYKASKDNNGIYLFENTTNFSGLQVRFLSCLSLYDLLYSELDRQESVYLDEEMLRDSVRVDAYLYYRKKKQEAEWRKHNQEKRTQNVKNQCRENLTTFDVDMRSP